MIEKYFTIPDILFSMWLMVFIMSIYIYGSIETFRGNEALKEKIELQARRIIEKVFKEK